jgi:hypothetical protein
MTITQRDPTQLRIAPQIRHLPQWSDDDARFHSLCDDIAERGIDQPLIIDPDGLVWDGRHRFRAARRMQLPFVPCVVRSRADVHEIALQSLLQRRHYPSKGALAYALFDLIEPAFDEARMRKASILTSGGKVVPADAMTLESWCERIGCSIRLLKQARAVHEAFRAHPDWKELDEPRIFDEDKPAGLGGIIAGFAGREATKGKPRPPQVFGQLEMFVDESLSLARRMIKLPDLDGARDAFTHKLTAEFSEPKDAEKLRRNADLLSELAAAMRARAKKLEAE